MSPEDEIPCVTQIPLTYGDTGTPIEPEKIAVIHQAVVRQFGGLTPLGTIYGGIWVDDAEHRDVREDQLRIEVWVPRSRIPVFKTLVRRIGYETRQKQMFVLIPEAQEWIDWTSRTPTRVAWAHEMRGGVMAIERKANYILDQAKILAGSVKSWVDFSAELFDQKKGLIAKTFPEPMEREAFFDSPQYGEVNKILLDQMKRIGVKEGAVSGKSGKFIVRVPKSLHESLEVEAKREGVSLNQLAVSKLAVPLRETLDLATPLIVQAFMTVHDGYSTDRVVVDPKLNGRFLAKCRALGINNSDYQLNHALLDIRKSGKATLPKTTKRTEFRDYDEYQFAAEIATRILQRTKAVTLDQILCDPAIAAEFDNIATQLAPGQLLLKLRCAALNLRKTHRLGPSKAEKKIPNLDLVTAGPLHSLTTREIPEFPATYVVYDQVGPVFAGETENLQRRIETHVKGGLPKWLDNSGGFDLILKQAIVPSIGQDERRLWLSDFVLREKPLLNFQKVA